MLKYKLGQKVKVTSGFASTFMDVIELHQSGSGAHELPIGSVGTIVEVDDSGHPQAYNVDVDGFTQWVQEDQIALKGGN